MHHIFPAYQTVCNLPVSLLNPVLSRSSTGCFFFMLNGCIMAHIEGMGISIAQSGDLYKHHFTILMC